MYKASVIADSIHKRKRLTSFEICIPRCVLAEINTHRALSRNSASSRAIPSNRLIASVEEDPFVPEWTAANKGMVASGALDPAKIMEADTVWLDLRNKAIVAVDRLCELGVAKQDANRLLEPFMFTTIVATGTDRAWEWFFKLRDHCDADPKIGKAATMMHEAYDDSEPEELNEGEWHLPYIGKLDWQRVVALEGTPAWMPLALNTPNASTNWIGSTNWYDIILAHMSAARCARISYLRQHEDRSVEDEVKRACELVKSGHWSPTEHQAIVMPGHNQGGNFGNDQPFAQFRHLIGDGY